MPGSPVADLKELAEDSLTLLKLFLYDERFPALFDLELYGSIIGMFELNNLSKPSTTHELYSFLNLHQTTCTSCPGVLTSVSELLVVFKIVKIVKIVMQNLGPCTWQYVLTMWVSMEAMS